MVTDQGSELAQRSDSADHARQAGEMSAQRPYRAVRRRADSKSYLGRISEAFPVCKIEDRQAAFLVGAFGQPLTSTFGGADWRVPARACSAMDQNRPKAVIL